LIVAPPPDMPSNRDQPERPRREPEIIPPGNDRPNRDSRWPPNDGFRRGTHRIYVSRIGPLGFALLLLILALFGGVFLLLLIGAALIWFPVLLVLALIAAIAGLIRRL
jgi:predicted cobalt transporter CbtA